MAKLRLTIGAFLVLPLIGLCINSASQSSNSATQGSTEQKPANPPPCPAEKSSSEKSCSSSDQKPPSAAERFPFPGEPEKSSPKPSVPDAPAPATPGTSHHSAADEHPFPGSPETDAGSSSSSSSSSGSDDPAGNTPSPDHSSDDKDDHPPAARKKLPKVEHLQSDEERATEDLNVAKFYEDRGSLDAAYIRAKDAVKYQPNDPDTHFALAHIAQKMNKREEAIAEFNMYLKLDPDGLQIKQARKALSELEK
jgi:tetratricopeptide (TPR) repeat protein